MMLIAGCSKGGTSTSPAAEADARRVTERPTEAGLVEQTIDLDTDGRPDIHNFYRERADAPRLLVRKEMDLNRDGRVDVVSFFDDDGQLEREEMDSDYDGFFDWTDHYQKGVRVMSEYDSDNDGRPNVFKYFIRAEDGTVHLDRKERDEDGDGRIDVWERFDASGQVIRSGRDTDGDGKVDVRDE
ncbi:MAG: hypothetical protein H6735_12740 [Alphaproteobacteria bacterium]|nr:hypothetical protein [Alphaproteobacteria bacterium]